MHAKRVTILSIIINGTLFLLKLAAAVLANSLAILADATNSLLDFLYSLGVKWSVEESHKKADKGHPFGHARAEPMVAFVIAILMGVAGFEFFRSGLFNLILGSTSQRFDWGIATLLLIAIAAKILLGHEAHLAGRRSRSPALLATAADSANDVLITLTALVGAVFAALGVHWLDDAAAIIISLFLFRQAYLIGKRNIDYLLGAAPPKELERQIRAIVTTIRGVRGIKKLRAHYVGNYVHVEIQVFVDARISTRASHVIAMTVQREVESLRSVNKAFVHLEPTRA